MKIHNYWWKRFNAAWSSNHTLFIFLDEETSPDLGSVQNYIFEWTVPLRKSEPLFFFSPSYWGIRSVSEGRFRDSRVIRECPNLCRAGPRSSANENLQRWKHYNPHTNPISQHQAPPTHQAQPLASNNHTYCQVIHALWCTHNQQVSRIPLI